MEATRRIAPYHGRFVIALNRGRTGDFVSPEVGDIIEIPNRNVLRQVDEHLAEMGLTTARDAPYQPWKIAKL